jgi:hypothetical protein
VGSFGEVSIVATQTVFSNEFASLLYHPDSKIVHHQWHQYVHGQVFRDTLSSGLDLLKKNHATKWLSDDRGNSVLPDDDAQWAQTVWFPAVKAAGWKHWAVVMPEKALGKLNMRQWISLYASMGINSQVFSDPEEALSWLEKQV